MVGRELVTAMSDSADIRGLLDQDFEEIESQLQNGHGGDPAVQGRALALLLRHVRILVRRNTVTEEECAKRMANCPGYSLFKSPKETIMNEVVRHSGWIGLVGYLVWQLYVK